MNICLDINNPKQTALELEPDSIVIAFPKQSFHHGKEMDNIYPHLVFLGKKM